jgi:hypothetical protein
MSKASSCSDRMWSVLLVQLISAVPGRIATQKTILVGRIHKTRRAHSVSSLKVESGVCRRRQQIAKLVRHVLLVRSRTGPHSSSHWVRRSHQCDSPQGQRHSSTCPWSCSWLWRMGGGGRLTGGGGRWVPGGRLTGEVWEGGGEETGVAGLTGGEGRRESHRGQAGWWADRR